MEQTKLSEGDCAYLAALLDTHARVRVVSNKRSNGVYRTLTLTLASIPSEVASWVTAKFGPVESVSRLEGVDLTYVTRRAAELCVHAYPYLVAFKDIARLVTRFASTLGAKRIPMASENVAIRAEIDRELQALERSTRKGR